MSYTDNWMKNIEWKENFQFQATLVYEGYRKGRSSIAFRFHDLKTNINYSMFISDFDDIVGYLTNGTLTGIFTFIKKGANYGLKKV